VLPWQCGALATGEHQYGYSKIGSPGSSGMPSAACLSAARLLG
jgi:hypothetical protein